MQVFTASAEKLGVSIWPAGHKGACCGRTDACCFSAPLLLLPLGSFTVQLAELLKPRYLDGPYLSGVVHPDGHAVQEIGAGPPPVSIRHRTYGISVYRRHCNGNSVIEVETKTGHFELEMQMEGTVSS